MQYDLSAVKFPDKHIDTSGPIAEAYANVLIEASSRLAKPSTVGSQFFEASKLLMDIAKAEKMSLLLDRQIEDCVAIKPDKAPIFQIDYVAGDLKTRFTGLVLALAGDKMETEFKAKLAALPELPTLNRETVLRRLEDNGISADQAIVIVSHEEGKKLETDLRARAPNTRARHMIALENDVTDAAEALERFRNSRKTNFNPETP
jgi:hypothetical protein